MHRLAPVCCTGNAVETPEPNALAVALKCKYDAFGRRTLKRLFANGQWAESRHYIYSTGWQLLQEWRSTPSDGKDRLENSFP